MNFKEQISECVRGEDAFCSSVCPFGFDIRDLAAKLGRGRIDGAYRIYRDAVLFPEIVSRLCPAPCALACPLKEHGGAIALPELERSLCAHAKSKKPPSYNIPEKGKKIAIIGGGMSGLACALRLCMKKYDVTVYEMSESLGGRAKALLGDVAQEDITLAFSSEKCNFVTECKVSSLVEIAADAYYIATGENGDSFGMAVEQSSLIVTSHDMPILLGGGLLGRDITEGIRHGIKAAASIDSYLTTGSFDTQKEREPTRLIIDEKRMNTQIVTTVTGDVYTVDEAKKEALRCMKCDCDICLSHCDLMTYYKKDPRRIGDEVEGTVNPAAIFSNRIATRMIASCEMCGMCVDKCPKGIDIEGMLLDARRTMIKKSEMPPAFSGFWLEDMHHADEVCGFVKEGAGHMFFPGCQLGAYDRRYVTMSYEALQKKLPNVGITSLCCGAPSYRAGDVEWTERKMGEIKELWEGSGRPIFILACPSCEDMLRQFIPEIKTEYLYKYLEPITTKKETATLFDPCTSRGMEGLQSEVKALAEKAGLEVTRSAEFGEERCCGFGGQMLTANPHMAKKIVDIRTEGIEQSILTYCTNCKDIFLRSGKRAVHILDVIFGLEEFAPPTWSVRRHNREILAKDFGKVDIERENNMKLYIGEDLQAEMDREYINEQDIAAIIEWCENTGSKLIDKTTGAFIGHFRLGYRTFWAKYKVKDDGFEVLSAYSHRMDIKGDENHAK